MKFFFSLKQQFYNLISLNACAAFQASGGKRSTAKTAKATPKPAATPADKGDSADTSTAADGPEASTIAAESAGAAADLKGKKGRSKGDSLYYRVKCKDNGVGMPHDKVRYIQPTSPNVRLNLDFAPEALLPQRNRKMSCWLSVGLQV